MNIYQAVICAVGAGCKRPIDVAEATDYNLDSVIKATEKLVRKGEIIQTRAGYLRVRK